MSTDLSKRGSMYYFRRAVPKSLRSYFLTRGGGLRTEWMESLGTKDRKEALRILRVHQLRVDALIAAAETRHATQHEEEGEASPPFMPIAHYDETIWGLQSLEGAELARQDLLEHEARLERDPVYAAAMEWRVKTAELNNAEAERVFAKELAAEELRANRISLLDLFDRYARIQGRSQKTIAQWRPYFHKLALFATEDDARSITHKTMTDWRNDLRDNAMYKGRKLSAKTINDSYLGAASAVFSWAKDEGLIAKNPMLEVKKLRAPKVPQLRGKELTAEEARIILRASLGPRVGKIGDCLASAKRWCPWLMAYSGARVNEITQLRKCDVITQEGIAAITVTPEAGTVKNRKFRTIPLHPHLVKQGFLDFVAMRPDGPLFYDASLRRSDGAINRQANRLGSKLAEWVRSLGIQGVKPNHGWRHLFNSLADRYEMAPRATSAIMGHAAKSVHDSYGSVHLDVMARELSKLPAFEIDG